MEGLPHWVCDAGLSRLEHGYPFADRNVAVVAADPVGPDTAESSGGGFRV